MNQNANEINTGDAAAAIAAAAAVNGWKLLVMAIAGGYLVGRVGYAVGQLFHGAPPTNLTANVHIPDGAGGGGGGASAGGGSGSGSSAGGKVQTTSGGRTMGGGGGGGFGGGHGGGGFGRGGGGWFGGNSSWGGGGGGNDDPCADQSQAASEARAQMNGGTDPCMQTSGMQTSGVPMTDLETFATHAAEHLAKTYGPLPPEIIAQVDPTSGSGKIEVSGALPWIAGIIAALGACYVLAMHNSGGHGGGAAHGGGGAGAPGGATPGQGPAQAGAPGGATPGQGAAQAGPVPDPGALARQIAAAASGALPGMAAAAPGMAAAAKGAVNSLPTSTSGIAPTPQEQGTLINRGILVGRGQCDNPPDANLVASCIGWPRYHALVAGGFSFCGASTTSGAAPEQEPETTTSGPHHPTSHDQRLLAHHKIQVGKGHCANPPSHEEVRTIIGHKRHAELHSAGFTFCRG